MIIDTHAHLYWDSFKEDLDEIIKRAVEQGVAEIYNIGIDVKSSQQALDQLAYLEQKGLIAYSSIGIHPHESQKYADANSLKEDIKKLEEIYHSNPEKVKFVGECGLDYYFQNQDSHVADAPRNDVIASEAWQSRFKTLQLKLFQAQIDLAKKLNLPLSIHCRDDRSKDPNNTECWDKVVEMTKDHFGIYHCYSGLAPITHYILRNTNFYFSFAGNLTYPNNKYLHEAVKLIPLNRIVVETDCPFLPPQNHRGKRNEPGFITDTIKFIAEIKNLDVNEVKKIAFKNSTAVFGLSAKP